MSNDGSLTAIDYPQPFDAITVELCASARRYVAILSPSLDHAAFDNPELVSALSELARESRQTEVRILIADSRPLVTRGHRLMHLARRIPTAVRLRKLPEHPQWKGETLVIRDRDALLHKPADQGERAFYHPEDRARAEQALELFDELWRYSEEDPDLRTLSV